ncbi:phosphotransferase enzyme family protein [Actinopolymorpha alba]|uniref:phosphotransferase enzyme family protein n=1 Tax=Actinopolymorpha alba TaxID=533267 RepID=UPI00037DCE2A|nr:phosphotransferase [Actinopolymorpha alba]
MRVVCSLLHPDDLATVVARDYDLVVPVTARLLQRGFNDTYLVTDGTGARRVLRVYTHDKYWLRSDSDLLFELELLEHLAAAGIGVAQPSRRTTGELAGRLDAPEGNRFYALFDFAPGRPGSERPMTLDELRALGAQVARLHDAMDAFEPTRGRYHLDAAILLDMPLAAIDAHRAPDDPHYAEIEAVAGKLKILLAELDPDPAGYGPIHADIHDDNIYVTSAGEFVFFDFDHCGYGWRAYDLVSRYPQPQATPDDWQRWTAYIDSYEGLRPLSTDERRALPAFAACRALWDIGDWLQAAPRIGTRWRADRLCRHVLDRVRPRLADLGW